MNEIATVSIEKDIKLNNRAAKNIIKAVNNKKMIIISLL